MRHRQIVKNLSDKTGEPQKDVKNAVDVFLIHLRDSLLEMKSAEIENFGVFEPRRVKEKKVKLPGRDQEITIPEHFKIHFTPTAQKRAFFSGISGE